MKRAESRAAGVAAGDIHIAGVLVHSRPLMLLPVRRALDALPRAEVFQADAAGKLVVVVEAACAREILDTIDAMRAIEGVLDVALVYQHAEPASSMQQEIEP